MSESKRKIFTGEQKAKVALEAVKGVKTINEIAQEHGVHPTQVSQWKKELMDNAGSFLKANEGRNRSMRRATLTGYTPRLGN
jgi:transposase-like protein